MNIQEIASQIEYIDIHNIEKVDIDVTDVLAKAGEAGSEKLFAMALVKYYYAPILAKIGKDHHMKPRALATAKWQATKLLTGDDLRQLIDRAQVFLLQDAKETGWHTTMEYDTLQELITSMMDNFDPQSSMRYDLAFIADSLLPIAKKLNLPVDMMVGATHQMMKLRRAVPICRRILGDIENGRTDTQDAADELYNLLSPVADPKITGAKFDEMVGVWHKKNMGDIDPSDGSIYIMPGNRTWMVIEVDDVTQRAIQMATKGLVKWELSDIQDLINDILKNTRKTNGL